MKELTGKKVKTIDGHSGIVIKHYKVTGRGMSVHIRQNDGRVWYCPDTDVIEVEDQTISKEETLKNIEYWENEVTKALAENDMNKATACRILANKLREDIGVKNE